MDELPSAPIVAGGLIGGFAIARYSGRRELGGGFLALAGACAARSWLRRGPGTAVALGGIYAAAFGGSHPLAKRIGAWPAVLAVSAAASGAAWLLADRRG